MVNVAVASRFEAQGSKSQPHRSVLRRAFPTIPDLLQARSVKRLYEDAYYSAEDVRFLREVATKGAGNVRVAKFLIDLLDNHTDASEALLAKGIRNQFVKLYETLSQRDQAKVFKQLARKFATPEAIYSRNVLNREGTDFLKLVIIVANNSVGNARVASQALKVVRDLTTYNHSEYSRRLSAPSIIDDDVAELAREKKGEGVLLAEEDLEVARKEIAAKRERENELIARRAVALDALSKQVADQLTSAYILIFASDVSESARYSLFKKAVKDFMTVSSPHRTQESYALRLGRILEYIGNQSGTIYAQMIDDLDKTLQPFYCRQEEVIENRFDRYKNRNLLRLVCARVSWSFDKPLVDMPVDEIQDIPATKKLKAVNVKRKTIDFFDTLFKNDATAGFAIEAMLSVPLGRQHLDELALFSGDRIKAVMVRMNEEQIKETLLGWVFPTVRKEPAEVQVYTPDQTTRAVLAFNIIGGKPKPSQELKQASLSQANNQSQDVWQAAVDTCFAHRMTAIIPRVYDVIPHDHKLEWKRKYVGYLVFFARAENEEAQARVKDVLKGQDKVAIVAATDYCREYALTFAIPELSDIALVQKRSKPLITRAERTLISFVKLGVEEANVPVRKIIYNLQRTALTGKTDNQRQVALNRLIEYSDGGLSFAEQSVLAIYRTLERQSERGQHWKPKRKRNGVSDKLQEAVARIQLRKSGELNPTEAPPIRSPFQPTTASARVGIVVLGGTPFMGILTRSGRSSSEIIGS